MTTTTNTQSLYSTMSNQDDHLFFDEQIQRFDADTIKNRYGDHWKNFVSNVREITQPDGSILKEYIIEDPSLLEEMKTPSQQFHSTSSATIDSDDELQQSSKHKFAQIKAKFEQKNLPNVMATPSASSTNSSQTMASRQNSNQQMDDLYARHRRTSNESIPINRIDSNSIASSQNVSNNFHHSQSIGSEKSKGSSFRRFDSADEADEEVRRIHRQGEELRRHNHELSPISSVNENPQQPRTEYEIFDEDGNPMAIDGVQDLIKMSGISAREVPQPDGSIIKEYVIDDPQLLSKFRSQQSQQSPMISSYTQQRNRSEDAPPPPPRVPLRQPILFRQPSLTNDNLPFNVQQIHVLEPQRRYEYLTTNGKRIQFIITNSDNFNGQLINDSDIRELTNAINTRLLPSSSAASSVQQQQQQQQQPTTQTQYTLPKPWHPAVDLTHRTPANRERVGSDTQPYPSHNNNSNIGFQQIQPDLSRSASYGALNQGYYIPQNQQPVIDWNALRQQDPQSQIDPSMVRQIIDQRHQTTEPFQSSAQFLPQQTTKSTHSPPLNNNPQVYYQQQQQATYPYQGQQQHGVRIYQNNAYDVNQQRTDDGNTRI